ncbi:phospholipase D-like domain-containing protein [Kitasatospora sp. NPDC001664]
MITERLTLRALGATAPKARRLLPALLCGLLLATAVPTAAVAEPTTYVTTGPVFNNPKAPDTAGQNAILGHLGRLTGGALPGSTVRISIYSLRSDWYAGKLAEAHRNGVNVQVLVDHTSIEADGSGATPGLKVKNTLDAAFAETAPAGKTYGTSWIRVCAPDQACLAKNAEQYAPFSNNHNKFFLFSRTTGSGSPTLGVPLDDVTVQSSGNLTLWDLKYGWNDAMTVVGNAELHAAYRTYFEKLTASQAAPDGSLQTKDYPVEVQAGAARAYFFPRATSDPIVDLLNTVDDPIGTAPVCYGNTRTAENPEGRTVIRIAQHQISRAAVAQKLWELAEAGCYVDVVYRLLNDWDAPGPQRDIGFWLTRSTKNGKISLHRLNNDTRGGSATHTKYLLVEGGYQGQADQKLVFTGSHPYTNMGLTETDEALLKYQDAAVHDAYLKNFRDQRAAAVAEDALGGVA